MTGISWQFDAPYEDGCEDQIVLNNGLGYFTLVSRELDGREGYIDFSAAPYPAGKCRLLYKSHGSGFRRARVILWSVSTSCPFEHSLTGSTA